MAGSQEFGGRTVSSSMYMESPEKRLSGVEAV